MIHLYDLQFQNKIQINSQHRGVSVSVSVSGGVSVDLLRVVLLYVAS